METINIGDIYYKYSSFYGRFCMFEFFKIKSIEEEKITCESISFCHNINDDIDYEILQNPSRLFFNIDRLRHSLKDYSWETVKKLSELGNARLSYLIIKRKFFANEFYFRSF